MTDLVRYSEPTLASLLEVFKEGIMESINCHQVGEIVSFDPSTQTAEVQIKMLKVQNGELKDYAVLVDCPVVVLGGGQGRITFPIKQGDSCLVLFNDRDIDNWYAGGQTMQPRTNRAHNFSDAIALVGVRNLQNKIDDYLADGTELKYHKSTIQLQNKKVTITDDKATITMNDGDITIENGKATVLIDKGGDVSITAKSVTVITPTVSFSGNVEIAGNTSITGGATITGDTTISGEIVVQGTNIGPEHTHPAWGGNTGGVNK